MSTSSSSISVRSSSSSSIGTTADGGKKQHVTSDAPKKKADLKNVHEKSTPPQATDPVVDVAATLAGGRPLQTKRRNEPEGQPLPARRSAHKDKVVSSSDSESSSQKVAANSDSADETEVADLQSQPAGGGKPPERTARAKGPPVPNYDPGRPGPNGQAVRPAHSFASDATLKLAGKYLQEMADLKEENPPDSAARGRRSFGVGVVGYAPFAAGSAVAGPFGQAILGNWAEPAAWLLMGTLDVFQGAIWLPLIRKESVGSESTGDFHEHFKAKAGHSNSVMGSGELLSAWSTMKKTDDLPFLMMPLSNAIPEVLAPAGYFKDNPAAEYCIKQFGLGFVLSGAAIKTLDDARIRADPEGFAPAKTKEVLESEKAALESFQRDLDDALEVFVDSADSTQTDDDGVQSTVHNDADAGERMQRHVLENMKERVDLQLATTNLALKGTSAVVGHKIKTMFTPGHSDGLRKTAMMVVSRCFSLAMGGSVAHLFGNTLTAAGATPLAVATVPPFIGQLFGYCMRQEYFAVLNSWSLYCKGITKGFPTEELNPLNPYDFNSPQLRQAGALQGMPPFKAASDAQAFVVAKPSDNQIASTPTITSTATAAPLDASAASSSSSATGDAVAATNIIHKGDMPTHLLRLQAQRAGRQESDSSVPAVQRLLRHLATEVEGSKPPKDVYFPAINDEMLRKTMAQLTEDDRGRISNLDKSELDYLGADASFVFELAQQAAAAS